MHLTLHHQIGKHKTIVIVEPIHAEYIKDVLTERLGLDTRVTTLGHTQRGGKPCALGRTLVRQRVPNSAHCDDTFPVACAAGRRGRQCPTRGYP